MKEKLNKIKRKWMIKRKKGKKEGQKEVGEDKRALKEENKEEEEDKKKKGRDKEGGGGGGRREDILGEKE